MRAALLSTCLSQMVKIKERCFLWGAPGIGKSSLVHQMTDRMFAADYGMTVDDDGKLRDSKGKFTNHRPYLIDLRAVLLDPVDMRGLPIIGKDGLMRFAAPDFLPLENTPRGDKPGVIFVDELPQAAPLVQAALLQPILDYASGDARISREWTWIAAGNRQEDRAGGHRIITSLLNRFTTHLDMDVHNDDWQAWAMTAGIAVPVRQYLKMQPDMLHKFDPSLNERGFPSPRSWEFVSRILSVATNETRFPLVTGAIGSGHAAQFLAFCDMYLKLPDPLQIIANPDGAPVPTEPDVLYALSGALAECVRSVGTRARNVVKFALRMPDEFCVLAFRDIMLIQPGVVNTPEGKAFMNKHRDALLSK